MVTVYTFRYNLSFTCVGYVWSSGPLGLKGKTGVVYTPPPKVEENDVPLNHAS